MQTVNWARVARFKGIEAPKKTEAISYGHITEGLGRLHLNDCKELGNLQATGKPQP